jgi:hypothetical protein
MKGAFVMKSIDQAYIGKIPPISDRIFYRSINEALESAMDVIRYNNEVGDCTVCEPVEIEKPKSYPYYICRVFRVRIIDAEYDPETDNMEYYDRYKTITIKESTLMD